MSDAKLASTHPRKARNTQLVKDPENDPASSIRGFRPAVWFARFFAGAAVSGDKPMIPRPSRVSSFEERKLEKVLSPPGRDVVGAREDAGFSGSPASLGGCPC